MINIEYVGGPFDGHQTILVPAHNRETEKEFDFLNYNGNYIHRYNITYCKTRENRCIYQYNGMIKYNIINTNNPMMRPL